MSVKSSGPLAITDIQAEFAGPNYSLSSYYRDNARIYSNKPNLNIPTSGALPMNAFYGATNEIVVTNPSGTTITSINLRTIHDNNFGAPSGPVKFRFINSGIINNNYDTWCVQFGDWPAGSIITLDNRGTIWGYCGRPNGGQGGSCIYVPGSGGTRNIVNSGSIYGGGGAGGAGGTGGPGYYQQNNYIYFGGTGQASWASCNAACQQVYSDSGAYCYAGCTGDGYAMIWCNDCRKDNWVTYYTNGGGGGSGGYGQGWNQAATSGYAGAAGGTNAGTGGTGGGGGGWGSYGGTGNNGGSGNNGSGSAGSSGGAPGYYIYGNGYLNSWSNTGSVAGLYA